MLLAMEIASGTDLIPSWVPSGPISRTSRARIRSLTLASSFAGAAMADHSSTSVTPFRSPQAANTRTFAV